jgi:hypothetical protein
VTDHLLKHTFHLVDGLGFDKIGVRGRFDKNKSQSLSEASFQGKDKQDKTKHEYLYLHNPKPSPNPNPKNGSLVGSDEQKVRVNLVMSCVVSSRVILFCVLVRVAVRYCVVWLCCFI